MKKVLKVFLIFILLISMTLSPVIAQSATEKEEVVYGLLEFDGSLESLYVVNRFPETAVQASDGQIIDYGSYTDIRNMTTSEEIEISGDEISVNTSAEQFFYQGTLEDQELPWEVSIEYLLDGQEVAPSELAGQSGKMELIIDIQENPSVNSAFYENYLLQVSVTLDTENFSDIESEDGTIASAGRNRVINHTVMPGEDARISVRATAEDFYMEEIEFSALPFSMAIDVPVAGDLMEEAETLSEAVSDLYEGVTSLNSGINDLSGGAQDLNAGASDFGEGIQSLSGNSEDLLSASRQIREALDQINNQLAQQEDPTAQFEELSQLSDGLRELAQGLNKMADGMYELNEAYNTAYSELDSAISEIPDGEIDPTPLYGLVGSDEELTASLNQLMEFYGAAKTTKGTYEAVREVFESTGPALESYVTSLDATNDALLEMADNLDGSIPTGEEENPLRELKNGMAELGENYHGFHAGLDDYMQGVQDLSTGYQEIEGGIASLAGGLREVSSGADELEAGTGELNEGVKDLPNTIQEEMDRAEALYDTSDFEPVSFVSEKNPQVTSVQFVFRTPTIELPEEPPSEVEESEELSFWQKLLKLFGLYNE